MNNLEDLYNLLRSDEPKRLKLWLLKNKFGSECVHEDSFGVVVSLDGHEPVSNLAVASTALLYVFGDGRKHFDTVATEYITVLDGDLAILKGDTLKTYYPHQTVDIRPKEVHAIYARYAVALAYIVPEYKPENQVFLP